MASRFVRPTVLTTKKKTLQDDLEKRKKQNAGIDDAQAYMDYIRTLTPTQQNATKNREAQAAMLTTNLRPSVPSLPGLNGQGGMNYALSKQALLTSEQMIRENRAVSLYDTEQVAYNPDTAHLASTDYLKRLQAALGTQMETSRAQDEQNKARLSQYDSDLEDWYLNLEGNKPTDWDLKALDTIKNGREYASSYELNDEERGRLTDEYLQLVARMKPDYEYQSQTPTLQAKWDALDKEIQRRSTGYQELSSELRSSPTFLTDSVYTPMTGESYAQYVKEHTGLGWFGQLADRIDKSNDTAVLYDYMMNPRYALEYDLTNDMSYRNKGYNLLTDDEKLEAAAAMAQGEETFTRWLSSFEATGTLTRRRAMLDKAQQENMALHPLTAVPMYGAARMADVVSSVMAIPQAAAALAGYDDPNSMLYASNNFSQNVGSVQEQAAGELLPWQVPFTDQKLGEFLYNGVTALANTGLAAGIGGLTKAPVVVTQLVMSSQAASNAVQNALTEGMDPTEAVARGVMSGIIEAFTEKYSIEALLRNPSSIAAFIGQNFLTEATEEGASNILNTVADGFISSLTGRESELEAEYNSLLAQGANEKEASQQVLEGWLRGLSGDVLLGGLTGGAMGTAVGAQTSARRSAVGKEVSNLGNVSKLVDIGLTMDVNGESNTLARTIKQAEESGKKVSKRQVGRLYETMYRELDEQSRAVVTDTMRDAVAERMVELGDSPEVAQEAADAVLAVVRNEKPSLGQRQSMARAQSSTQVIKEIMFADDTTSEGRMRHSEWVRTADEKASAAGAASLRKMGELRQTRVGKEATDQVIRQATVNAQQMMAKKATDKKSMDVELEDGQSAEILHVSNAGGEAKVTIKGADGKKQTVSASDLRIKSRPVAAIVSYLDTTSERMSDEQANLLLHSYTGGDAAEHIADFNDAYAAGFMARELPPSKRMDRRMAQQIAEQGRKDAEAAEQKRQATIGAIATGRRGAVTFSENAVDMGSEKALKAVSDRLSDTQKRSVSVLKKISHVTGVNFVLFESQADDTGRYTAENGRYDVHTGTIYLDLNSGKNSATDLAEYAILRTAGHELTHFMEHSSKEGYAALRDFVTTELTRRGQDFDALVRQKIEKASTAGHPLTRAGAISEVVADASELMLRDTKAIERLAQKDQGLVGQIKGFLRNFVSKLRRAFEGVDAVHEEARVMMQELAEEFQQKWDFALEEAVEKAREGVQEATELREAVTKQYAIRDSAGNALSLSASELEENKKQVAKMQPVVRLNGNDFKTDYFPKAVAYFEEEGNVAVNPVLGDVHIEETGLEHLMDFLSARKTALIPAIKDVIANGSIVHYEPTHKGKPWGTAVIAAKVNHGGEDYYMGVAVRHLAKQDTRYYIHDAIVVNARRASTPIKNAVDNAESAQSDSPSIYSILLSIRNYNREFAENQQSLREQTSETALSVYEQYRTVSTQLTQAIEHKTKATRAMTDSGELDQVMELLNSNPEEGAKAYKALLQKYGMETNRVGELQKQANELYKRYEELQATESANEEARAIEKSGKTPAEYHRAEAVKAFGYTPMFVDAGYLLPNGKMLNFSGEKGKHFGMRGDDHRAIGQVFANMSGSEAMVAFMQEGNIRLMAEAPGMDIASAVEPTAQQYTTIRKFVREYSNQEYLSVDFTDENGREVGSLVYEGRISADRVVNDIKHYYATGQIREQGASAFHYSLRDMPADLTREYIANLTASDALNDVEKDAIRIYSREVGLLRTAQEKLDQVIAERDAQPEEKQKMYAQRVRDLRQMVSRHYDRLTQLEKTKGVAPLIQRSREYVQEYVQGKTAQDVENLITSTEQEVERLNKLIQAGNKDLVKERDRRARDLKQLRDKATQALVDEQERFRQMIATDREVRKLTQQARQMQEKISTRVRKLDKLRRQETDYKNIPEAFKPAVDTLVSMFTDNFGTMVFDKQRADRLSAIYHKLLTVDGNDPMAALKPFYDPNMEEYLEALTEWAEKDAQLRTTSGTRLEKAQLRLAINKGILDAVDHIMTIVTNAQDLFYAGKKAKFAAIGTQMGDALKARQDKKTLRGAAGQALTVMDNLLRTGNMTPVYFFEQLGNEVLSTLWDDIRQGQNAYAFAMRDGREIIQGLQQLYHYWDWADSKRKDNVLEITTEKGRKLTFTREQALWVYATWKREQSNEIAATKHLTEGGIVYEGKKQEGGKVVTTVQSTPAVLSEGDIARITGWLTDEQKAYADGMVRYLSEDMAELGNRASMEMFGIRKYTESYYFPYRTERDQLYQSSASGRLDTTSDSRIKHASFTHPLTKGASAPLVMGDFSAAVEDHIAHMATYASFVLPIESMNRVLNYKVTLADDSRATVRSLIEQKYGESAKKYIATLLTDLNGGVRNDNRASGTDYLVRMYKKGAVAASLSTALQQPTSIFRAMAMISPKYIVASTFSKRDWQELTRYSGVAVIKEMGRFDTDVGRSNIDWLHKKHPRGFMERLDAASGFLPEQLDRLTWAHLWSAVKKEQADLHPEMDKQGEAFLALCGERFNDIVDHTQVYDSILSRSQLMRGKDAMSKMTTSFMAEPTLAINMLYNAAAGFTKPGGKAKAAKVMAAVLTSNIAAAAMAALIQAWNDDDDKRSAQTKYMDKFLENALDNNNPLSMLPVVSDVWSMFQGYDVQRADMSLISEMYKAIQRFQSDSYSPYRKMEELLGTTAKFFGLPVKNLLRDGRRAYNLFASSFESPSSYELSTALPWADDKATEHYEELFLAMHNGDTKREEEIRGYLTDVKDKQTDAQNEGVRDRLKERFLGGSMDEATAKAWLKTHMGYDNRKAFETVDRWRETQENKGNEEWSYSIYNDFYDAVESGKNLNKEIKQLLDLGIEAKTLADNITTEFKPLLLELLATGKMTQAAALQAKILDAYVALGYDREKKLKDVKKWYEK